MSKPPSNRTCRFEVWIDQELKSRTETWGGGLMNCADEKRECVDIYDRLRKHPDLKAQLRLELTLREGRAAEHRNGHAQHQESAAHAV